MLLCHHCQQNCLCSTHMGQMGKPIRINEPKKECVISQASLLLSPHAAVTVGQWKRGERGGRRWRQLCRWQCPASGAFSPHCQFVCISVLLFIISYATTHFQTWHDTRNIFIGHMHLQKVITLTPVVITWRFYHRIIESLTLEKSSEIVKSSLWFNTTTSTKP